MQEGKALVDFPKDFVAQVHTLFEQWARRYDTLQDWAGPRKYDETPAGQLLKHDSDDPKVRSPVASEYSRGKHGRMTSTRQQS